MFFICSVTFCTVSASQVVLSAVLCVWGVMWPPAHAFCRYIFKCYSIKTIHRTSLVFFCFHSQTWYSSAFCHLSFPYIYFLVISFYGDSCILFISLLWTSNDLYQHFSCAQLPTGGNEGLGDPLLFQLSHPGRDWLIAKILRHLCIGLWPCCKDDWKTLVLRWDQILFRTQTANFSWVNYDQFSVKKFVLLVVKPSTEVLCFLVCKGVLFP